MSIDALRVLQETSAVLNPAVPAVRRLDRPDADTLASAVRVVWASQVEREQVEWLDPKSRFIPKRAITVLAGMPGLGKSMFSLMIAAKLSREGRRSLLFTAEDSWPITIRPRLEAYGADLDLIGYAEMAEDGIGGSFTFPDDVDTLAALVRKHEFELMVIDPLVSHLTRGVNSWHDQSIRTALAPLHHLAEEHNLAVLCVGHLNKREDSEALMRLGGSIGIPAAARSALLMSPDPEEPDEPRRIVARIKCNIDAPVPSCVFEVDPVYLPATNGDPEVLTARLNFLHESDHNGEDLLQRFSADDRAEWSEAEQFLAAELESGPALVRKVKTAAKQLDISDAALQKAKKRLQVRSEKDGFGKGAPWYWLLPDQTREAVNDEQLF